MIDSTNTNQDILISPLWKHPFSPQPLYSRGGVPSLVWFCLQCIAEFPDQVKLHHKLVYQLGMCDQQDLLRVDPRLWAVIVQIFDHLPLGLQTYTISLNDEALPLLQRIPNIATFSLMTILELPGCVALTDSSISQLKDLHTLTAFDASGTRISSYGLLTLARTLQMNDPLEATRKLRGPWALRILRLKHCTRIDDAVYATLAKFPLLSVVDLRGTNCRPRIATLEFSFSPSVDKSLFSSDMVQSLSALQNHENDLQMHSAPKEYRFTLRIKALCHKTIAKNLNQKTDHFRPPLGQPSRISADNYGSYWTGEDRSDRYSQQSGNDEESASGDIDEQGEVGGNVSHEREEQASDEEVGEDIEEHGDSDGMAFTTKQERSLNAGQKVTDDSLVPMVNWAYPYSKQDYKHFQVVSEDPPTMLVPSFNHGKPHWYDADWTREHSYVPMSLAKGKYDSKLMLYRPARPWNLLENELDIQLAKEARRKQARTDGHNQNCGPDLFVPPDTKNLLVQEDMKSMAAEVVRRRRVHDPPTRNEISRMQSRNPFTRKHTEAPLPVRQNNGQPKPLKPISALPVPKITHELLQRPAERRSVFAGPENELIQCSTITKNRPPTVKSPTGGSLAQSTKNDQEIASAVSRNLREEYTERKTIPRSGRISMSSDSMVFNSVALSVKEKGGRKGGQKTQSPSFDWAAWASKKS